MKVQTLVLAASAALILSAQGVAQSDTGLERALTELNAGLTAPVGSASMAISGDFRLKNEMTLGGPLPDRKDATVRARLNFDFNVNENVSAHLGGTGGESWDSPDDPASHSGLGIETAYVTASNLIGDGGSFKIGRDYWTMGSGRINGSDDWDANPSTESGVWYSNGGFDAWMLNDGVAAGGDSVGFSWDYAIAIPGMGDVNLRPYYLTTAGGGDAAIGFSSDGYGAEFSGTFAGFAVNGEFANDEGGGNAYAVSTSMEFGILDSIPGVSGGSVDLSFSKADADFNLANGTGLTWGQAGYSADGRGVWDTGLNDTDDSREVNSIGMNFSPMEGWNGRLAHFDVDGDASWNVSASTTLAGAVDTAIYFSEGENGDAVWLVLGVNF